MSGFTADWLQRREPFDLAARNAALAQRFTTVLHSRKNQPRRIIDLAAGSGANFRALAPLLGGDQDWLLVDHDAALIAAQVVEIARWSQNNGWQCEHLDNGISIHTATAHWRVRAKQLDLAQHLEQLDFSTCNGVTTTAFLDLVSAAWLERLCKLLSEHHRSLLATLSVDGRRNWHPALPVDQRIQAAFQHHQNGDKGFGPALGSLAASTLGDLLAAQGYTVDSARSDWRIGVENDAMLLQMINESATVACEVEPASAGLFDDWKTVRHAQAKSGQLKLEIGHLDLLAIPA